MCQVYRGQLIRNGGSNIFMMSDIFIYLKNNQKEKVKWGEFMRDEADWKQQIKLCRAKQGGELVKCANTK